MKTPMLVLLALLASSVFGFAGACPTATYDQYLSSGFSCTINDKSFSNFSYSTGGSVHMPASGVTVNPLATIGNPGFLFNAPWGVSSGQTQDSLIGFTVNSSGALITDLSLQMFGAGFTGTGMVSVAETYCIGDTFGDLCAHGTEGTLFVFLSSGGSKLSDSVSFAGVRVVDVMKDVSLIGGTNGSAAVVSGVENRFSEGGTTPEPGTIALFGSGVLGLAAVLRRRMNR